MRRSHGFSFLPGARARNFRVDRYPVSPEDLLEEGRVWYGEDDDTLRYSKTESGLLVPRRVLDSEPKWADLTAPINPDSGVGVSTPSWEAFRGDFSAMLFCQIRVNRFRWPSTLTTTMHWVPRSSLMSIGPIRYLVKQVQCGGGLTC